MFYSFLFIKFKKNLLLSEYQAEQAHLLGGQRDVDSVSVVLRGREERSALS